MNVTIYYDGDCPFCSNYVRYLRLQRAVGSPHLVDVRRDTTRLDSLKRDGYDLDQGMVAEIDGRRYAGADAMHMLALLASPIGPVNTVMQRLFSNRYVAYSQMKKKEVVACNYLFPYVQVVC